MSNTYFERQPGKAAFVRVSLTGFGIALLAAAYWAPSISNRDHVMHSEAGHQQASSSARPATIVRPISCERLPNVPGKSVTTAVVEFPPDA